MAVVLVGAVSIGAARVRVLRWLVMVYDRGGSFNYLRPTTAMKSDLMENILMARLLVKEVVVLFND